MLVSDQTTDWHITAFTTKLCDLDCTSNFCTQDFFSSDMTGLKQPVVESNIKRLKTIVGLYRKTTENLIADYISAEAPKEAVNGGDTFGEVAIEVSTQIHPTTGELDGQIRGNHGKVGGGCF